MIHGYIYKITTTMSDKVYIGQTTRTIEQRFAEHLKHSTAEDKKTLHLYLAMAKYGKDTFSVEQLDTAQSQEELNEKECYWINFYNSINNGYNMMQGGNNENPMNSDIVKAKHDAKMRSVEVRTKISETMSKLRTTQGFSDEHKQKIRESREKRKAERKAKGLKFYDHPENMASRALAVYCILENGDRYEFDSILHAGQWWFDNYKPFGEVYSVPTFQRKIEASINGKLITFGNKTHKNYKEVTNIKWFYVV